VTHARKRHTIELLHRNCEHKRHVAAVQTAFETFTVCFESDACLKPFTYKIINEKYDKNVLLNISRNDDTRTRGNSLKLKSIRIHYNLRKYSFSIRIINIWNSLPENVVTANTIDCFKTRLDKSWNYHDVKFDYKQNLTELHNRSMIA